MKASVSLATPSDAEQFTDWQMSTADNLFDPAIATYPSLRTLRVDIEKEPVLFCPFHPVFVVESLAHRPGVTKITTVRALLCIQDILETLAKKYGIAEIWWMGGDEKFNAHAQKYGYELVTTAVLRKKVC
jgi:hypothetical protein